MPTPHRVAEDHIYTPISFSRHALHRSRSSAQDRATRTSRLEAIPQPGDNHRAVHPTYTLTYARHAIPVRLCIINLGNSLASMNKHECATHRCLRRHSPTPPHHPHEGYATRRGHDPYLNSRTLHANNTYTCIDSPTETQHDTTANNSVHRLPIGLNAVTYTALERTARSSTRSNPASCIETPQVAIPFQEHYFQAR